MGNEKERREKKESVDIFDLLNLRIAGIDIGRLIRELVGTDIQSVINNPGAVDEIKNRLEGKREELRRQQEELRKRFGDAIRVDYDIRIGGILGGEKGLRIGGGEFFSNLDELARERSRWKTRPYSKLVPLRKIETPTKEEVREPIVDIFEEEEEIIVVAELPGVPETDIEVKKTEEGLLQIKAGSRFYKEIKITVGVDYERMAKRYNNGVLEMKLPKKRLTS